MIRTHLVKSLYENLLGPKLDSNEIIEQPYLKYELGVLNSSYFPENNPVLNQKPIDDALNPDINEIPEENIETYSNNENTQGLDHLRRDVDAELSLAKGASSLGLSFVLASKNNINETHNDENIIPKFKICLTWARYTQNLEFGLIPRMFNRHPNFFATDWINPDIHFPRLELTPDVNGSIVTHGGVFLHIITTKIKNSDKWVVRIFLVNESQYDVTKRQKEVDRIFQPQIRVIVNDAGDLGDLDSVNSQDFDEQDKSDALLYHNLKTKAKGYLCAAVWKDVDPEYSEGDIKKITWKDSQIVPQDIRDEFLGKTHVRTEYLPLYSILQPEQEEHEFNAEILSNTWNKKDLEDQLRSIEKYYEQWIKLQNEELTKDVTLGKISESIKKTGIENLKACTKSQEKISKGIDFLINNEQARAAFCFMNAVMNDKQINETKNVDNPKGVNLKWREFQMAFILQSLTGVTGDSPEERNYADVLWFPTGGGKTEAYLGIVIFAIAFRRLSFDPNPSNGVTLSNDGGVSVISRYTLRLLTVQQFHRALGAIVVADIRRVMNWLPQDAITGSEKISDPILLKKLDDETFWGNQRFSIGLWIGNKITPKQFSLGFKRSTYKNLLNCEGALLPQWDEKRKHSESSGDPDQIQNCPLCKNILCIPQDQKIHQEFIKITWIVRLSKTKDVLEKLSQKLFEDNAIILKTKPIFKIISHPSDNEFYYRLTMEIKPKRNTQSLDRGLIDTWWKDCVKRELVTANEDDPLQSTCASMPGYFFLKHGERRYDFAMFCTNEECDLNQVEWFEKLENKFNASIPPAFQIKNSKNISRSVPISAFVYDDQIYSKCPSLLIATVDKFANLPFEPKCASIFGNVDVIHPVFGYGRRIIFESPLLKRNGDGKDTISPQELQDIPGFNPPSLILQDELHLIEGPLGSMMGIYEMAVDVLSNNGLKPKYIASSATIKEAKSQVGTIFRKKVSIFPSPGINSFDNYFSKIEEDTSCIDEKSGRLYVGMLSGKTAVYLPIQAQSIIMAEIFKMRKYPELYDLTTKERADIIKATDPYWTFVSYFTDLSLLSKFTNYYLENIVSNVRKSSSVEILNSSIRVNNQTFTEGLRLFPIISDKDMFIETVSIFCTNSIGRIRIAIYKDVNPIGKPIVTSVYQECIVGENNFNFDNELNYEIKNNEKIWISVINDNSSTAFESVNSQLDSFEITPLQVPDDFPDTFQNLSKLKNNSIKIALNSPSRFLSFDKNIQLSSETDAHDLVKRLEELQEVSNIDSLQTSPVFGTGIDVTRLGIIQIMNQPKTNSGYIQSSGRVGRNNFGLVLTWLRAGRARDLNHYENFIGYHRMIHKFVEPITASPFSDEAMALCLGPIMVAILRNARQVNGIPVSNKWIKSDGEGPDRMRDHNNDHDVLAIREALSDISQSDEIAPFRKMYKQQFETHFDQSKALWHRLATELYNDGKEFVYQERIPNAVPEKRVVLGTPAHKVLNLPHVFENVSNSLRQTEPAAVFYGGLDITTEIRPSQFITRYGPGTLLSGKYQTFVVPSIQNLIGNLNGKRNFAEPNLQGNTGLYKYQVNDSRMRRILLRTNHIPWQKLKLFSLPTNTSLGIPSAEKIYCCDIFPKWVYCINKIHDNVKILAELNLDDGTYVKCPECQRLLKNNDEKSKKYTASTLVIACSEGHLDDVNWPLEIHRENDPKCTGDVFSVISSGGNDNAVIRCMGHWNNDTFVPSTCNSSVDNLELKTRSNTGQIVCTAKIAETGHNDRHSCSYIGSMSKAKLTNKTQMSIRMPLIATSMEIKPQKSQLFNTLQPLAGAITHFVKTYLKQHPEKQTIPQEDFVNILKEEKEDYKEITSEVIRKTENVREDVFTDVIDQIRHFNSTPETPLELLSEKQAFEEELSSLETQTRENGTGVQIIPGSTSTKIRFPIQFPTPWNLTFESMPFEGVNVTQVQIGYSREISLPKVNSGIDEDSNFDVRIGNIISDTEIYKDENDSRWYLANQLRGEGIFIHLDPQVHKDAMDIFKESNNDDYVVWKNIHQETLEKNNPKIKQLRQEERNEQKIDALERQNLQTNPLFVWWHSFAHEFINQLSIDSGFSGVSLGERIYCVKKSDDSFTAGIFIYASSPGTDGTLGGLTSLVDDRILPVIVNKTLHKITSCSNDPICSASKINNQRRTGAACHICLMNSETSCAYLNKYLDRNLVQGTLNG